VWDAAHRHGKGKRQKGFIMNPDRNHETSFTRQTALWISGIYLVFGVTYIYISGWIVLQMYSDPTDIARAEMYKGWGFILSSAVLLFVIVHIAAKSLRRVSLKQLESHRQYERMIETTNEGVWKVDANARTTFVNQTMAEMLGTTRAAIVGKPETMFLDEPWNTVAIEQLRKLKAGSRDLYECQFRRPDGSYIWALIAASPMTDAEGNFIGVLRMVTDITKRKETESALHQSLHAQRQLLNELDHRVRNNLSSLISLIDISRSTSENPDTFASSIRGRIDAMNRAHTLLSSSGWKHQSLRQLLEVLVPDEHRARINFDGPAVRCAADVSGAMAVLFHELLVNAIQHGSLSSPKGRVEIEWSCSVDETDPTNQLVTMSWREINGPPPSSSITPAAGLRLVTGLVKSDFHGSIDLDFPSTGASHTLHLQLAQNQNTNDKDGNESRSNTPAMGLISTPHDEPKSRPTKN